MRILAIFLLTGVLTTAIVVVRSVVIGADKRTGALEKRLNGLQSDLEDLQALVAANKVMAHNRSTCQPARMATPWPKAPEAVDKSLSKVNTRTPDHDLTPEEQAAAGERDVEKLRETMESNFAVQPVGRNWGDGAATEVRTKVVARLPKDSQLRSIECRESMCRLETSHHDEETYRAFVSRSLSSPDFNWQGTMAFVPLRTDSSGEITTVAYLMRPGYLPPYADEVN